MSHESSAKVKYIVSADGTRLYSGAAGDPTSTALIFVDGLGARAAWFATVFKGPRFSKDYFLVRPP